MAEQKTGCGCGGCGCGGKNKGKKVDDEGRENLGLRAADKD